MDAFYRDKFGAAPQWDPGAHVYTREAIELLRRQRDTHGDPSNKYDELSLVASNLRDAYEWMWPLLWTDDKEFVPFAERAKRRADVERGASRPTP